MGIHLHEVAEHVICKKAQRKHAAVLGEAEAAEGPLLQPGVEVPGGAWLESVAARVMAATGMGLAG